MEVIVQWLDDLEDLIFAIPLAWERLRIWCLQFGLLSALLLAVIERSSVLTNWVPTLALAAALSVGVWTVGLVVARIADRRYELANSSALPTS